MTNLDSVIKKQRHHFADKGLQNQSYGFCSSHVWMWVGWEPKNWCFQIVVLEKTLQSPLDSKESKPVHPKENQLWIFIGSIDAEAEALILWSPDVKRRKDPNSGKDRRQKENGVAEDEIRWLESVIDSNGHEFKQIPRNSEGHRRLVCCSPWGCKESDTA